MPERYIPEVENLSTYVVVVKCPPETPIDSVTGSFQAVRLLRLPSRFKEICSRQNAGGYDIQSALDEVYVHLGASYPFPTFMILDATVPNLRALRDKHPNVTGLRKIGCQRLRQVDRDSLAA